MATIADRLKELRRMKGIDQIELAKTAEVSRTAMGKYESGDVIPKANALMAIARKYSVSMDWLCGFTEHNTSSQTSTLYDFISMLPGLLKVSNGDIQERYENQFYNGQQPVVCMTFRNYTINEALKDAYKIIQLYNDDIIDDEVFALWKEKTRKKYTSLIIDFTVEAENEDSTASGFENDLPF